MTGYSQATDPFINHLTEDTIEKMIDASWLSGDVARIACRRLSHADTPYLADALEEAGCTDDAMLLHLRQAHQGKDRALGLCSVAEAIRHKLASLGRTTPSLKGES